MTFCLAVPCRAVPGGGDASAVYRSALVAELSKSGSMPLSTLASKVGLLFNTLLLYNTLHIAFRYAVPCALRL